MSSTTRNSVTIKNQQLRSGLMKYLPKKVFELDGETWKTSDLIGAFDKEDGLIAAAVKARAAWVLASKAAEAETATNDQLRLALKPAVIGALGPKNEALAEFGIAARSSKPRTGQTNVAAAQKAAATRKARGTLGRKQRLAIQGAVTPAATPAAPAAIGAAPTAPNGVAAK